MSIIPDEELKRYGSINLAPMVDFLFLIIAIFATLAITRTALFDSEVNLVKVHPAQDTAEQAGFNENYVVNLSVTAEGRYKWITEFNEYLIDSVKGIQQELVKQQNLGLLPKDKALTQVLLHIDKEAMWEPIAQVIFAIREIGFDIHPVYDLEVDEEKGNATPSSKIL